MNLWGVLDLKGGLVVRGIAGNRESYRPVKSLWADSADPLEVARGLERAFGIRQFYLADLDALTRNAGPDTETIETLNQAGYELMVDAGVVEPEEAAFLIQLGVSRVVVPLECSPGIHSLERILKVNPSAKLVFSLDLKQGTPWTTAAVLNSSATGYASAVASGERKPPVSSSDNDDTLAEPVAPAWEESGGSRPPLATERSWLDRTPIEIVDTVVQAGISSLIVLDISAVGTGQGVPTLELCSSISKRYPGLTLISGGGVRGIEDLQGMSQAGITDALVASSLHDGRILPDDLKLWLSRV